MDDESGDADVLRRCWSITSSIVASEVGCVTPHIWHQIMLHPWELVRITWYTERLVIRWIRWTLKNSIRVNLEATYNYGLLLEDEIDGTEWRTGVELGQSVSLEYSPENSLQYILYYVHVGWGQHFIGQSYSNITKEGVNKYSIGFP